MSRSLVSNAAARTATLVAFESLQGHADPFSDSTVIALQFWRNFVAAGGLQLDSSIWSIERGAVHGLTRAVEAALVAGKGASRAASEFMYHTPDRHDWLLVDDGYEVEPDVYLPEAIGSVFHSALSRCRLAVQVFQGIAAADELERLDGPP